MTLDVAKLRALAETVTQPGPWAIRVRTGFAPTEYSILDGNGMWFADLGASPLGDAEYLAAVSPSTVIALLDEIDRLRATDEEWSALCNQQHALLEQRVTWPPTNNKCGWCVRAAGDNQAAAESLPTFTIDEIREHSLLCANHPLVAQLAAMTAARDRACSMLDDAVQLRDDASEWFPRIAELRKIGGTS